jgi:hypothetical protein
VVPIFIPFSGRIGPYETRAALVILGHAGERRR